MNELDEALDMIDVSLLKSLRYGEEYKLTDRYTLYHYDNDEVIVVNIDDGEEWTEFLQVIWDTTTDRIEYEVLESGIYRDEQNR